MDFLKTLALPQPAEHFQLLLFITNLIFILFLPYFGLLLGAAVAARACERKGRPDGQYLRLARDLASIAVFSKSGVAFLALVPAMALLFVLIQILQQTEAIAAGLMFFAFLALLAGSLLIYAYKYTFRVAGLLSRVRTLSPAESAAEGSEEYERSNAALHEKSGRWGVVFLVLAFVLTTGALTIGTDPSLWNSVSTVFGLLLVPQFYVRLLYQAAVALGATGIGALFFLFVWEGGEKIHDEEYRAFVERFATRLSVISLLSQPVLLIAAVTLMPPDALSSVVFFLSGLGLILLFFTAQFLYSYHRDGRPTYVALAAFAFGLALIAVFSKDQVALHSATKTHAMNLSIAAERELEALRLELGIAAAAMSGEDIYNAKCSACHLFDQKKVGPPYSAVLPKYAGKKDELIKFVLNPVKVDPAYPPMPNQGLKPAEGDSIATYLLNKYGGAAPQAAQK
jgi:cytochrome c